MTEFVVKIKRISEKRGESGVGQLYVQRRRRRSKTAGEKQSWAQLQPHPVTNSSVRLGQSGGNFKLKLWQRELQGVRQVISLAAARGLLTEPTGCRTVGGGGGGYPSLTRRGCLLRGFTGNSRLLASWRGCLWSPVELLRIWWTPAVGAHPAPRWPPHYHTW